MTEKKKKSVLYILLASVAVIWGLGFVFMKQALAFISPAMLNVARFSAASLLMFALYFKRIIRLNKKQWLLGAGAGLVMAAGFGLQSYGTQLTSAGNSALLTGLNVVMVPFFAWIFYKKRPPVKSFAAAVIAFSGISFLGFGGFSKINAGDLLCFLCAVAFAVHFIIIDKISKKADTAALAFVQILTCAVVFAFIGLVFDFESLKSSTFDKSIIFPMLSLCVLSTGYAYVVQTAAQKLIQPSKVSLILSCESVLGAAFSVLMRLDQFTWYLGVSMAAVTLALFISEGNFRRKAVLSEDLPADTADGSVPEASLSGEPQSPKSPPPDGETER